MRKCSPFLNDGFIFSLIYFSDLSQEIARLQTELNSARLQEFEAQEQVTLLTTQLEEERSLRQKGE